MIKNVKSRIRDEKDIFARLSAGLSENEIRQVLAGAVASLGRDGVDRLAKKLRPETGNALRRALAAGHRKGLPEPGPAKVREEWERAWEEWNDIIARACDEEGDYVIQEHDWEAPYFDPTSVTHDLEPIAAKMAKLLPQVFEKNIDPNFSFAQAVRENVEEISSGLPDWMDAFQSEGFDLGPQVTRCLIEWEWRKARRQGMAAFPFVDQLCELEASSQALSLDEQAVAKFIRGLDAQAKNEIRIGMQKNRGQGRWKRSLDSAYSGWFQIYKELCRGQDRPAYLENCRTRVNQDWTLALPVVKDLRQRKDHAEILKICGEALRSFLHLRPEEKWDVRENFLAPRAGWHQNGEPDARLLQVLEAWENAARALKEGEAAAAIRLQADLLRNWKNWDKALAAFQRITDPGFFPMRQRLFTQWRDHVAEQSLEHVFYDDGPIERTQSPHWIHALADAAWEGQTGQATFQAWLRRWLAHAERNPEALRRSQNPLARLSLDIETASWLSRVSPALVRILADGWSDDPSVRASRRKWLERMGASFLVPELLSFWKRNIRSFIPDPARVEGSNYDRCAAWVQAFSDLQPEACREMLHRWSDMHRRRRNLWRALRKKALPVTEV